MLNSLEGATALDETAGVAGTTELVGARELGVRVVILPGEKRLPEAMLLANKLWLSVFGIFKGVEEGAGVAIAARGRF